MKTSRTVEPLLAAGVLAALLSGSVGCGRQVIGVAKPAALLAWEPCPQDATARITTVKATAARTYVGFSNGERFFKTNAEAGWMSFDKGPSPCDQPTPRGALTAFAVTQATAFIAFAGTPGAPGLWRSPDDESCWAQIGVADDFWNLSVSPFSTVELLASSRGGAWVSHDLGGSWDLGDKPRSFHFEGAVQAVTAGTGPTGTARAWLGDDAGHIYYSDDLTGLTPSFDTRAPDQLRWQPLSPDPGFPARRVVAISIDVGRPRTIWVTFMGLSADSLWTSDDGGLSWRNPRGGELSTGESPALGGDDGGTPETATFTAVSPVPAMGAAYVTALRGSRDGELTTTSYWIADGSESWWRM